MQSGAGDLVARPDLFLCPTRSHRHRGSASSTLGALDSSVYRGESRSKIAERVLAFDAAASGLAQSPALVGRAGQGDEVFR